MEEKKKKKEKYIYSQRKGWQARRVTFYVYMCESGQVCMEAANKGCCSTLSFTRARASSSLSHHLTRKRRSLDRRGPAILTFHAAIFVNLSWTIRRRVEANERKKWRKRLPILSKDYLRNVLRFTPLILVTTGTTWPSYDCARQPIDIGRKLTLSQLMHASINPFRLDTSGRVRARSPLLAFFFAFASLSFTWTQDGWALLRIVVEKD